MEIYIIGAGGNGKIVADICESNHFKILGFFDDKFDKTKIFYNKYSIVGTTNDIYNYPNVNIIISIGDNQMRRKIYEKLQNFKLNWPNCIHYGSYISPSVKLGFGNIICNGSIINADTRVGNFNLINTLAIIEHDCTVKNFNHFGPKTTLCGNITIGDNNLLGVGTSIIPSIKIGNNNIIGAMSAVITNIDNCKLIIGVPGFIKKSLL